MIPQVSARVREIYRRGLELGNNPQAYSKIGDCGSTPAWFLGDFDRGPRYYNLGEYTTLEDVIQAFQGSHGRTSLAAKSGFNASSVLTPLWADRGTVRTQRNPPGLRIPPAAPGLCFYYPGGQRCLAPGYL